MAMALKLSDIPLTKQSMDIEADPCISLGATAFFYRSKLKVAILLVFRRGIDIETSSLSHRGCLYRTN